MIVSAATSRIASSTRLIREEAIARAADRPEAPASGQLAFHLARCVGLEHVALFYVLEVCQHDAAFEAFRDLFGVVVESLQRVDRRLVDNRAIADNSHVRVADQLPCRDLAAGDRADLRCLEGLADLCATERVLNLFGLEHPCHRVAQFPERLVDH